MSGHKGNLWTNDEVFEVLQAAYRRGVDFACEHLNTTDDDYSELWKSVPKASYDYADKATSPSTPNQVEAGKP